MLSAGFFSRPARSAPRLIMPLVALAAAGCARGPAAPTPSGSGVLVGAAPSVPEQPPVASPPVSPTIEYNTSPYHPKPDPRIGLKPGQMDAGQAIWNMRLLGNAPPSEKFVGVTSSDLAFTGHYAIQGNYNGFQVFDISNPSKPTLTLPFYCPASQSDVSVYGHLLFVSAEAPSARLDCAGGGVADPVSKERIRGIRIFDISDIKNPKYISNVQTCRGSHTHTVVTDPKDSKNVYIYISGTSSVRSAEEVPGCVAAYDDPNTAQQRLEIIKVPLDRPQDASIVAISRLFAGMTSAPSRTPAGGGRMGGGAGAGAGAAAGGRQGGGAGQAGGQAAGGGRQGGAGRMGGGAGGVAAGGTWSVAVP